TFREAGALDGEPAGALHRLAADPVGPILGTRLRDGTEIRVGETDGVPRGPRGNGTPPGGPRAHPPPCPPPLPALASGGPPPLPRSAPGPLRGGRVRRSDAGRAHPRAGSGAVADDTLARDDRAGRRPGRPGGQPLRHGLATRPRRGPGPDHGPEARPGSP